MKKVININFQGRVVMIEEEAYENLKSYIESLRRHFANEEGCDEIVNDIENRISELFAELIKKGSPCVSENDLDAIIHSIGKPEDFDEEEKTEHAESSRQQAFAETPPPQSKTFTGRKQFCRDETNKKIGGVCAGIANYFNIDVTLIRIIAIVSLFVGGAGVILYIILWIATPSSATQSIGATQKRLYRDLSHKTIGGVCSGLANYFNIEIWVPKIIFLLGVFLSPIVNIFTNHWIPSVFFPGTNGFFIALYIVLWAVVPAAVTTSDKLSMKGENVDLNSIKNAVQGDLSDDKKKVNSAVNDLYAAPQLTPVRHRSVFGDIIVTLFKVFAWFVAGCVLIGVIAALSGIGIAGLCLYPLSFYFIGDAWQNILVLVALTCFIWVPVVGIIIWIIRLLTKTKSNAYLSMTLTGLWVAGLASVIGLIIVVRNSVRYHNNPSEELITLSYPKTDKLQINYLRGDYSVEYGRYWFFGNRTYESRQGRQIRNGRFFRNMKNFSLQDSILINNTDLQFVPSDNDSFSVSVSKMSDGNSVDNANLLAQKINYESISQQDSTLNIPSYFFVNPTDKFRNQFVSIVVAVPVGKKIIVRHNDGWFNRMFIGFGFINFNQDNFSWDYDTEYIMTKDGLKQTAAIINNNANSDQDTSLQKIDDKIQRLQNERQQIKDRREQRREQLQQKIQQLQDSSNAINA